MTDEPTDELTPHQRGAITRKKRYGDDFHKKIGALGGGKGGFFADRELARRAGAKGGALGKRGKAKKNVDER